MTETEFFKAARKIDGWKFYKYNRIQIRRSYVIDHHGRNIAECLECPITAVANARPRARRRYSLGEWDKAGKALKLPAKVVSKIVDAADSDHHSRYDVAFIRIRRQLMQLVAKQAK
jgi:hypothetical protein